MAARIEKLLQAIARTGFHHYWHSTRQVNTLFNGCKLEIHHKKLFQARGSLINPMESIKACRTHKQWAFDPSKTLSAAVHDNAQAHAGNKRRKTRVTISKLEEKEHVHCEAFPNIDNSNRVDIVYTRRSRRNLAAREAIITEEPFKEDGVHTLCDSGQNSEQNDTVRTFPAPYKKSKKVVKESQSIETQTMSVIANQKPWTMLVHKKLQPEWRAYNPLTMRPGPLGSSTASVKLLSWNVNGLRALLKRKKGEHENPIWELSQEEEFDVLCLQETKLQEKDVGTIKDSILPGYNNTFWNCSITKLGYSGTAVISRIKPLSVRYGLGIPTHDHEGRLITLEFDSFYVVAGYIPNSGQKLERLAYRTQDWDSSLGNFIEELEKLKPVILTGDLNCAHQEMDIFNPDGNRRSAGFTDEERSSFEENILKRGLVDTFRRQHPEAVAYTYWGYRTAARPKNQGWRLDYFLASQGILERVHDSYILPHVNGSDHCPIGLVMKA